MKNWFTNTKNKFFVFTILSIFSFGVNASSKGIVSYLKGNAFIINNGQTKSLKIGDPVYDFSEVITEEGSDLTINDYYDHKYHLSGSGQFKILNKIIELKRGFLWVQSFGKHQGFNVQTANAVMEYNYGDYLISFDVNKGKTQVVTVTGVATLTNTMFKDYPEDIKEGQFSFVWNEYENGVPRKSTPIGYASFQKLTRLFPLVEPISKNTVPVPTKEVEKQGRYIASEANSSPMTNNMPSNMGKVIVVEKVKPKKDVNLNALYNKKLKEVKKFKVKKKFKPTYVHKSGVPIKVYGKKWPVDMKRIPTSGTKTEKKSVSRGPSSIPGVPKNLAPKVKIDPFEKSLINEYKTQLRHKSEVLNLIDDLESYKQDYKKDY